jgi:polyhydroxyalkanoate synthesis regulator phasin
MNTLQNVYDRLSDKTELAKHEVNLGLLDDINKLKQQIVSNFKSHVAKRDTWGSESSKILQLVSQHETKGVALKKEVDLFDKQILDLSSQLTKLRNQAAQLGLELPQETNLLDGVQIGVWSNKFVDTREIVDEFKNKLK